jgi:phospholipase C
LLATVLGLALLWTVTATAQSTTSNASASSLSDGTATPIKHVVFQENVSFDHYFGTYPNAENPSGEPAFHASPDTPSVNGLNAALLHHNPNADNPQRLDRSQALTCDQDHGYTEEQKAFDNGLMDKFVEYTNNEACTPPNYSEPGLVMDYYDGNSVTALWNYAQHFSMSDNSYNTVFGPSSPGHINLISGQTHGATPAEIPDEVANGTMIGDPDPTYDDCSGSTKVAMSGKNIGDLLNEKVVSWGWFQGGFRPTSTTGGKAVCGSSHKNIVGQTVTDYSAHHEPFQYYESTSNPHRRRSGTTARPTTSTTSPTSIPRSRATTSPPLAS